MLEADRKERNTGMAVMRNMGKVYNCIVVFNKTKDASLFCMRRNEPYKGRYNFVGGKVEPGEESESAAYRELQEETGISRQQIRLFRLMDIRYYHQNFDLELYVGQLESDVVLKEEKNPLFWLSLDEDFAEKDKFAGEQNIAHIMNVALQYPIPDKTHTQDGLYIGVDGCKGGWIAAILDHGSLQFKRYARINEIVSDYSDFDAFMIDMAIGLRNSADQLRPDKAAKEELGRKSSSVFPIPSRDAVYAEGEEAQKQANFRALGKSLSKQSIAIIPKIKELDVFLNTHPEYKNRILESHPEVVFSRLNGAVVASRKKEFTGIMEREQILSEYLEKNEIAGLWERAKEYKCKQDDLMDAVCLAVAGALHAHGLSETIPGKPEADETGLYMQLTVPRKRD